MNAYHEPPTLTFEQHAVQSRANTRRFGLADCIHYAPDWQRRADALYAFANAQYHAGGPAWWRGEGTIGLLADGRMCVANGLVYVFEEIPSA